MFQLKGRKMAYKPIDPSELEMIHQENNPSSLEKLGQFATGIGVKAATAPLRLVETADQLLGLIGPQRAPNTERFGASGKYPTEQIEEAIGEKYTKPENIFSKALQATAGNWPLLFLGGAPTLGKIGADISSSLGMTIADSAGFGPLGQIAGSVLGSRGFNKVAEAFHKGGGNPSKIAKFTSDLYEKERKLGSKIPVESRRLTQDLNKLRKSVEAKFTDPTKFTSADKSNLLNNISTAAERLTKPNLNASDIFDIKKTLNEIYISPKSVEGREFAKLRSIFTDELNSIAKNKKNWGNAFKGADELYSISKWQTGLSRYLKDLSGTGKLGKIVSNPLTYGALSVLGNIPSGSLGTATLAAGGAGALLHGGNKAIEAGKRSYDFINSLSKTKEGQRILWDIAADSAKGSATELAKSIHKLDKKAAEFKEEPSAEHAGWQSIDASELQPI